jgi:hypothetical protein
MVSHYPVNLVATKEVEEHNSIHDDDIFPVNWKKVTQQQRRMITCKLYYMTQYQSYIGPCVKVEILSYRMTLL